METPSKAWFLMNLGLSQQYRSQLLAEVCDIDNSIANLRTAVSLARKHDLSQSVYLFNLGISQALRFQQWGDQADIEEAISNLRKAV